MTRFVTEEKEEIKEQKEKMAIPPPHHSRPPKLIPMEFVNELAGVRHMEREDPNTTGGPIRLFIDGLPQDTRIYDIDHDMIIDHDMMILRTEDKEEADIIMTASDKRMYGFERNEDADVPQGDIDEFAVIDKFEFPDDVREDIFDAIIETSCSPLQYHNGDIRPAAYTKPERLEDCIADPALLWLARHKNMNYKLFLHDLFKNHLKERGITQPTISLLWFEKEVLEEETFDHTTPGLTKKAWKSIFSAIKDEASRATKDNTEETKDFGPKEFTPDWSGLRDLAEDVCREKGLSERDVVICSRFMVPDYAGQERTDLKRTLQEEGLDLGISQAGFNAVIRRNISNNKAITNTDLGRIGESFTHRLLLDAIECHVGPEPSGVCDISDTRSGVPSQASWAINVKLNVEDEPESRALELSPEYHVDLSFAVLILSRRLEIRVYPVEQEYQSLNPVRGGLCVRPEELGETIKGLIEGKIEL